jgi:ASC-1-like (ASCH) protein
MQCPACGETRLVRVPMRPPECAIGKECPPLGRRSMRCAACESAFCDVCLPWPAQEAPLASKGQEAEAKRQEAEAKRQEAEAKRQEAEAKRQEAEAKRQEAEAKRQERAASKKAASKKAASKKAAVQRARIQRVSKGHVAAAPAPAIMKSRRQRRTTAKESEQKAPAPQRRNALPFKKRRRQSQEEAPSLKDCVLQGKWPDGAPVGAKSRYTPVLLEQYADAIRNGSKTHEGRPFCGFVAPVYMEGKLAIHPNDYIIFKVKETGSMLPVRVLGVKCYPAPQGFREMVADVGIAALLPGFDGDLEEAVNVYRGFKNQKGSYAELESKHGAVAIAVQFFKP